MAYQVRDATYVKSLNIYVCGNICAVCTAEWTLLAGNQTSAVARFSLTMPHSHAGVQRSPQALTRFKVRLATFYGASEWASRFARRPTGP